MEKQKSQWMIYGANGFTGRLIAEEAKRRGHAPILAGRNATEVRSLATEMDLPWRAFNLHSVDLEGVSLVLHCAGPFSATGEPMLSACLKAKAAYLDITGEIPVFEAAFRRDAEARQAGSVVIPGVGFDVVPTDCLALKLAELLPEADRLELAIDAGGKLSRGTMKTALEGLPQGGCVRIDGKLTRVPPAHEGKFVDFMGRKRWVSAIPWGDVSTAFRSTGIPNIVVYAATPRWMSKAMKLASPLGSLIALEPVQNFLKAQITKRVSGPDETVRSTARCRIWGQASKNGARVTATLEIPEGYHFTAVASVTSVERVLRGDVAPGVWTPSRAFGSSFVTELPDTHLFH